MSVRCSQVVGHVSMGSDLCWELLEGSKTLTKRSSAFQDHVFEVWTHLKNWFAGEVLAIFTVRNSLRISLPTSNFGKKRPIFCKFLDGFDSYAKTFQEVQGDCQCGPLTPNIILLKFEGFSKNRFFDDFFWKNHSPPGMDPALLSKSYKGCFYCNWSMCH